MSVKKLTDITLTDLWKEFNSIGEALDLIVTDGKSWLENEVDIIYPFVKRQRCWAHKLRNVAKYLKRKDVDKCIKEARAIYSANNKEEAEQAYGNWRKKWVHIAPKAVRCIEKDLVVSIMTRV